MKTTMENLQSLGRALMLPIAVLPAAGLLLRLGQPDLLDISVLAAAGDALFANLGLLFAIGVAVGFAREGHGAAGLSGAVCFLVVTFGAKSFVEVPADQLQGLADNLSGLVAQDYKNQVLARLSVPIGILSGIVAGILYNRYANIKLPEYLAFFGGKRFVPIASAFAGIFLSVAFGLGAGALNAGIEWMSAQILASGSTGLFAYGVLNRLLIVTGLHHILNNGAWFVVGEFNGVTGDLNRFFAGDPEAGGFMSGFFPIMMFGLPAACFAMYRAARPERRKEVGGMLGSMALTSFLTGVTEPVEFTFMFLAPILYGIHAVLTGLSMAIMDMLNVKLGFGFSAGLFDYVINFTGATNPLLLLPLGAAYGLIYYFIFSFAIRVFDLKTPGREINETQPTEKSALAGEEDEARGFISALGGAQNLISIGACTTRLRLSINDGARIDEAQLRRLGAKGFVRPSDSTIQIIIGPRAELLADQISAQLGDQTSIQSPDLGAESAETKDVAIKSIPAKIRDALGGEANIALASLRAGTRLFVDLVDPAKVSESDLNAQSVFLFTPSQKEEGALHLVIADRAIAGSLA